MSVLNFWVDIEDSSGNKLGAGPLRPVSFAPSRKLSASGEFSFDVSIADPNISALAEKRVAICRYIDGDGTVQDFAGGVIDNIVLAINPKGAPVYTVSGNDLVRELSYRSVGDLSLTDGAGSGVTNGPTQIMALAPSGWSINSGTTTEEVYVGFDGETVLNALARVGEHVGEHWRLGAGAGREIDWLGAASGFEDSGIRAVQHVNAPVEIEDVDDIVVITALEEETDAAELLTRVIPRGSGNGSAIITLAHATDSPPAGYTLDTANNYLKEDDAETTYGQIERVVDFKEIGPLSNTTQDIQAAANFLLQASLEHLRRYSTPPKFYRLELANVNQVLQPGTTMRVVYREVVDGAVLYDLDDDFIIVEVESSLSADAAGARTTAVQISTTDRLAMSDAEFLASQAMEGVILSTHPQLGASVDTLTWREEMDNSKYANFRFWLGEEYTSIQNAAFRFRVDPLRSTVKSVAGQSTTTPSGGGSTTPNGGGSTTPSGGGSTSGAGGASTPSSSASIGNTDITYLASVPGSHLHGAGSHYHNVTLPNHYHSTPNHAHSTPNHSHSTPNHQHTFTPNINMVYGIFEESGANTLAIGDLVIKLNGGSDLSGDISDIGNGWYELDITDELVDAAFRPDQENNALEISTSVAKTARIEAQLTVRGVVQAIAYT